MVLSVELAINDNLITTLPCAVPFHFTHIKC